METCPHCESAIRAGTKFCTSCGKKLEPVERPLERARLVMLYGQDQEVVYPIQSKSTSVGREIDNDLILRDRKISKHHARITSENGIFWITDLDSRNGVYVNGRTVLDKTKLNHGCLIKLGITLIRFEYDRSPGKSVETQLYLG